MRRETFAGASLAGFLPGFRDPWHRFRANGYVESRYIPRQSAGSARHLQVMPDAFLSAITGMLNVMSLELHASALVAQNKISGAHEMFALLRAAQPCSSSGRDRRHRDARHWRLDRRPRHLGTRSACRKPSTPNPNGSEAGWHPARDCQSRWPGVLQSCRPIASRPHRTIAASVHAPVTPHESASPHPACVECAARASSP